MTVKQDLIQEFETIKGQYIIHFNEVFRVVGLIWSESAFDYYWLLYNGRELTFGNTLGRNVVLKGYIEDRDYNNFIEASKLNDYDYIITDKEDLELYKKALIQNLPEGDRMLVDLYLNQ